MTSAGPGQAQYEIRGLSASGGESPTIGFYLGETPITPPATATTGKSAIDPDLYDLARVEVLRGPKMSAAPSATRNFSLQSGIPATRNTRLIENGPVVALTLVFLTSTLPTGHSAKSKRDQSLRLVE